MNVTRLEHGFFSIERDGKRYFGIEVGSSRARISSSLTTLKDSVGRIFSPQSPNTQETWQVSGHMSFEDVMIVYGPWIDVESDLSRIEVIGAEKSLTLLAQLTAALERMPGEKELFSKGLLVNAFLHLKDGRFLMLPHQVQDLILSLHPSETRFKYYDAYHHPSLKGNDAFRFGLAVLSYRIACGKLPWDNGKGTVDYAHRILAGSFAGPGSYLETSTQNLETLSKKILGGKTATGSPEELQSFLAELLLCYQGKGDTTSADTAKQSQKKREKSYQTQSFWKKNGLRIAIVAAVVLLVSIIPASIISKELRDPRTLGMPPDEVVKTFYKGFNDLDTELMEDAVAKGVGARAIDTATNFYVVDRIRTATESRETRMAPEEWIKLGKPVLAFGMNVFGIAELQIDEKTELRKDNSHVYEVRYDFYFPGQAPNGATHSVVEIEHRHEQLRVTQNKDRKNLWQIVELKTLP